MLRRYKEIFFGLLLGLAMWVIDAAMHAALSAEMHGGSGQTFVHELFQPGATVLFFRSVFVFLALAFGWTLWRSNWRERELRALEAAIASLNRQLNSPAMRIVSHARMLMGRPGIIHDEAARELAASISDDARVIDELALAYMNFSERVAAGRYAEAIETLHRIEARMQSGGTEKNPRRSNPLSQTSST
jgi:signal transduction histidine kinase